MLYFVVFICVYVLLFYYHKLVSKDLYIISLLAPYRIGIAICQMATQKFISRKAHSRAPWHAGRLFLRRLRV